MRKICLALFMIFLLGSYPLLVPAQEEVREGRVIVKEVTPFVYACVNKRGDFAQIQDAFAELMQEFRMQNLTPMGGLIGVYYMSMRSRDLSNIEWEIGFPVPQQTLVQAPLQRKVWNNTLVAATIHVGSYDTTGETYLSILNWMEQNRYEQDGPVAELYQGVPTGSMQSSRTELWVACREK